MKQFTRVVFKQGSWPAGWTLHTIGWRGSLYVYPSPHRTYWLAWMPGAWFWAVERKQAGILRTVNVAVGPLVVGRLVVETA